MLIVQPGAFVARTTVTGLPSTPSRNDRLQPQARVAWVNPFSTVAIVLQGHDHKRALISASNCACVAGPMCLVQIDPSRATMNDVG